MRQQRMLVVNPLMLAADQGTPHPLVSSTLVALGQTPTMEPFLILTLLAASVAGLVSVGLFAAHTTRHH